MKKRESKNSAGLSDWVRFLESYRPVPLPGHPAETTTLLLGYKLMPFHRRFIEFTLQNQNSLVLAPRGHGKSTVLTIAYTIHSILADPETRVLIASNTAAQSQAFLREIKAHLESNPRVVEACGQLRGSPWTESEIVLASRVTARKEATVTAMGVMGPVISKHYDIVILDDVVDEEAARSGSLREKLLTWYYKELLPTIEPEGQLHLIGTRYHHDDLYGSLIKAGMPALVERAIKTMDGEEYALWEDKFPLSLLRKKREQAGPAIFNTQYQNDVAAMRGRIIRPEWIKLGPLPHCPRKFQGIDLAIGSSDHHDYFAHVTVGEAAPGLYHVARAYRARLSFEEQFNAARSLFEAEDKPDSPVIQVGVESNSYQQVMTERLRKAGLPAVSVVQTRDKVARLMTAQGLFQTGAVSLPDRRKPDDNSTQLIEELLAFPEGAHDDLVDAFEIALRLAREASRYRDLPFPKNDINP